MLEIEGLTKIYGGFTAVSDLSVTVRQGEILGLIGPNGAGKTTSLRCAAGILPPTAGTIRICGHDMVAEPIAARQQLAFMNDEPRLFDYLTVSEHLQFIARIYQVAGAEERAIRLLAEMELSDKADALPITLSRGMKQKLQIACGLIHDPRTILFDEPLTGLDPAGIRRMKDSIVARAAAGAAIIVSSHLLHLVEEICHRVLVIRDGVKVAYGTIEEIKAAAPQLAEDASLEEIFLHMTRRPDRAP
jgi:ABC-2 type transport system ATP-binding protein